MNFVLKMMSSYDDNNKRFHAYNEVTIPLCYIHILFIHVYRTEDGARKEQCTSPLIFSIFLPLYVLEYYYNASVPNKMSLLTPVPKKICMTVDNNNQVKTINLDRSRLPLPVDGDKVYFTNFFNILNESSQIFMSTTNHIYMEIHQFQLLLGNVFFSV